MTLQPLVDLARERGGLGPDDLVACLAPLFRQVIACHEAGLVAPLRGLDALSADERYRVALDPARAGAPVLDRARVRSVQRSHGSAVEVVRRSRSTSDTAGGGSEESLDLLRPEDGPDAVTRPVVVAGWTTWEHVVGHHDELTDVASLGLLLAALACGLDLADGEDAEAFAANRLHLFALRPGLHPVVAQLAARMTEPDRHARAQDLPELLRRLETYRDQPLDFSLAGVPGVAAGDRAARHRAVLEALRDRLFDLSRRNRLVYFRGGGRQSLDLTEASVPLLLDVRNIEPKHLFTWPLTGGGGAARVLGRAGVTLGSVIRWDDAPFAAGVLDGLIAQARRDHAEYGASQLRLVTAFLRWHDLKNEPAARISSPLLLLPVELTRRRGVRDGYQLRSPTSVAEVNPALRQVLDSLYGLTLPETVDLSEPGAPEALRELLSAQIRSSEPAVELTLRDRPRIELVQQRARLRLAAYRRRGGRPAADFGGRSYAYSYRRKDLRPLGIQLFEDRIRRREAPTVFSGRPAPRAAAPVLSQETYVLDRGDTGNPYRWEIDLCAVTLATLNYRTMSLVRDYRELISTGRSCAAFDQVFSLEPRPLEPAVPASLPLADRHLVVPADGSQVAAVARAREGGSFVIQGPPGTGKSQTITNLIADHVARGQRVLFVCQKRAAIDVVHARLRSQGLDELTCLIHDSQADKKAFVRGLKATYESWLADPSDAAAADDQRDAVVRRLEAALAEVASYEEALARPAPGVAGGDRPTVRDLVERLVELGEHRWGDGLAPAALRLLPDAGSWWAARPAVARVAEALTTAGLPPVLADTPWALLAPEVLAAPRPEAEVAHRATLARDAVTRLTDTLAAAAGAAREAAAPGGSATGGGAMGGGGVAGGELRLGEVAAVARLAAALAPAARRGRAGVLRRQGEDAAALRRDADTARRLEAEAAAAAEAAAGWRAPLAPDDAAAALGIARAREGSALRWLSGDWRRVRAAVRAAYDPGPRAVPVPASRALELLVAAQRAEAARAEAAAAALATWGHEDPADLADRLDLGRAEVPPAWLDLLANLTGAAAAEALAEAGDLVEAARLSLDGLLDTDAAATLSLGALAGVLADLAAPAAGAAGVLRRLGPALAELAAHPAVGAAVRALPATPEQLEHAVAAAGLRDAAATDPELDRFDGDRLRSVVETVQDLLPQLYAAESAAIVAGRRAAFLAETRHASQSVTGMSVADRERKKTWSAGRRALEHEFGKQMRYRSIRELSSGDPGRVVAALRPVWLMSPASVSDTLPLDPGLFDVVVYDEASQIPVEEAVPAMHRADQVIVVGDRMQLPPTQYFTARGDSAQEQAVSDAPEPLDEADDDEIGVVLDGDSFLAQSAVRLPSTMLTWHYRSRYEALIAFSNAAFYGGRLATVPDRTPDAAGRPDVRAELPPDVGDGVPPGAVGREVAAAGADALLGRSISLHRVSGAVYRRRANSGEAAYVAALVRELLLRDTGLTLGVVAFSEAQQGEIERALEALARTDDEFARRYEAELVREDGEQAVGLFVKNLENVQGDERDVIVMSVCYAPGPDGRMLMNFGPVNQRGGEKRLNVIMSRARRHMAVVTTIEPDAIRSTWNDGAATMRRFLAYAAAVSRGDAEAARTALAAAGDPEAAAGPPADGSTAAGRYGGRAAVAPGTVAPGTVAPRLAAALRAAGVEVAESVGQSAFRADLALRRPGDDAYRVAVLIDTPERVAAQPVAERVLGHPAVLRGAGWQVAHVLATDWLADPGAVVADLVRRLPPAAPAPPSVAAGG